MSASIRVCGALAVLAVMIDPAVAFGQSSSVVHRPWVGFSLGTGFLGGNTVEPDDSRDFGLTADIPLQRITRIRVGTGRMQVHGANFSDEFPLRRLTVDGVALKRLPDVGRACESHALAGGGIGLYHYGLDHGFSATRKGYQLFAGAECVGRRVSIGLEMTGRSIRGPANLQMPDRKMFALDMHLTFKLRL